MTNHKTERVEITNRFKQAFEQLEKKGTIARFDRHGKGYSDVAEIMFGRRGYGHVLNDILGGKRYLTAWAGKAFCQAFEVSEDWLFKGEEPQPKNTTEQLAGYHYRMLETMENDQLRAFYMAVFAQKPNGSLLARIISNAASNHIGTEALKGNGTPAEQLEAIQYVNRGNASVCSLETLVRACGHENTKFVDVTDKVVLENAEN